MALLTRNEDEAGNVELFTAQLKSLVTDSLSFTFQIHVTDIVDGYQIELTNSLLKEHYGRLQIISLGRISRLS